MAVTTEYSAQYSAEFQAPHIADIAISAMKLETLPFTFTQGAAAGDVNSLQYLRRLPAGLVWFFPYLSRIRWTAFGAARTLDIGYGAHTSIALAAVVADDDAFDAAIDVSSAGVAAIGSDFGTGGTGGDAYLFETLDGVDIFATTEGDTIPAAATLIGWLTIGRP